MLGIVGVALVLSVIATMLDTPRYTAVASLQINDRTEEVLGEDLDSRSADGSEGDVNRFLNTQLDILRSRALALRVAKAFELYDDSRFFTAMEVGEPAAGMDMRERREQTIELLRDNLTIDLPYSSRVVRLRFSSTDPELSARIANGFAEEFIQANLQRRFDSSAYARKFVENQLDEARDQLEHSEQRLNSYAGEANLIRTRNAYSGDDGDQVEESVTVSSLHRMKEAVDTATAKRIAAQTSWRIEAATSLFSSRTVLSNPTVQELMTRRANARAQLEAARMRYLSDHPALANLRSELSAIEEELTTTARQVRQSVQADYQAAAAAEAALQRQLDKLQVDTLREQDRAVRYNTLAREADTARSIYDGLLQRYRTLNASAGVAATNIAIVDRAEPTLSPSSPSLPRNLSFGFLGGLLIGIAAVYFRDRMDDAIHVPEDMEERLDLPLLGVVPKARGNPLDDLADSCSLVTEAYISLRGMLLHSIASELPFILAVTSAQPGEGKTTSSHAIARGFGRLGMKTLLIDADLRRPAAHVATGSANTLGLSDLLTGREPLACAVQAFEAGAFDLLSAGSPTEQASELTTSPRMAQLLNQAVENYEMVVVDCPPVLGLADAPALAALADGTIMIVEADRARSEHIRAVLQRLYSIDSVLLGGVLTKFDPDKGGNYHSAYYGRDQYHRPGNLERREQ